MSAQRSPREVLEGARALGGFLTPDDVANLADDPRSRLWPLLVRCGGCRFTAPAQDVKHLVEIVTREGSDYVRDVSLVAGGQYGSSEAFRGVRP